MVDGDDEPTLFASFDGLEPSRGDLMTANSLAALMTLPKVGPKRAIRLADAFGSWANFLDAPENAVKSAAGIPLKDRDPKEREAAPEGVRLVGWFDADYPPLFKMLQDPPAVLWVRGSLRPTASRIAVVGTREPTAWGEGVARMVARQAAERAIEVVSGLALGIDIAAHRSSLEAGGRTTAILGSGVDAPSPAAHRASANEIVERGGALVAEVRPGTKSSARTLVARNRLQAALSSVTLVVQCSLGSGTMHTATFTNRYDKLLAVAVPPAGEAEHVANAGNRAMLSGDHSEYPAPSFALASTDQVSDLLDLVGR